MMTGVILGDGRAAGWITPVYFKRALPRRNVPLIESSGIKPTATLNSTNANARGLSYSILTRDRGRTRCVNCL